MEPPQFPGRFRLVVFETVRKPFFGQQASDEGQLGFAVLGGRKFSGPATGEAGGRSAAMPG
jgi:hypothetical protein